MKRSTPVLICLCMLVACKGKSTEQESASWAPVAKVRTAGVVTPRGVADAVERDPRLSSDEMLQQILRDARQADAKSEKIVIVSPEVGNQMSYYCTVNQQASTCDSAVQRSIDWSKK